ncbi:hypothetical protein A8B75_01000 [Sphingomonadales bacterium EhC05]|nr:hypothetical protein A8B75_01000 [Sphingomonadales bacterium EhC05]
MTDKKQKPVRITDNKPPVVQENKRRRSWLGHKGDEINKDAEAKSLAAGNRAAREQVKQVEIATDYQNGVVDYRRAEARNTPANIKREIVLDRAKQRTDLAETKRQGDEAKAGTKLIVDDYEARAAEARHRKDKAENDRKAEALRGKKLDRRLAAMDDFDVEEEREKLLSAKEKVEAEIKKISTEIETLLGDDADELEEGKRHILEGQLATLKQRLIAIDQDTLDLDGDA